MGGLVGRFIGNKVFCVIKRNDSLGLNVVDPQVDIDRLFFINIFFINDNTSAAPYISVKWQLHWLNL